MHARNWLGAALGLAAPLAFAAPQTVDIMVLYTDAATKTSNGRDIDARIASYIEYSNTAYAQSNIDLRLRLVHKQKLDWANYADVTSANLDALRRDSQVQRLREQYGADVVSLINLAANAGNGYITCGIGYMGSGAKNSDAFYSWAKDIAYNLVGVDCGLNTFAHEAGHNMGLRHSYEQDQQDGYYASSNHSGTHEWSRGYGVYGKFSTIMGYPHVFNARTQAPYFSNPLLVKSECSGQACGMDGRADATRALNTMASQIAGFRPSKVPSTGNPTTPTDPVTPTPTLPWCSKPALKGLVSNGEFANTDGWQALFGAGQLSTVNIAKDCRDNALLLDTNSFDLAATPVSGLRSGTAYTLRGKVMLKAANSRENVNLAILSETTDGRLTYSSSQLVQASVTGNEFTPLERSFTYQPASNLRNVYVAIWTASGASLLADEISLVESSTSAPSVPPAPSVIRFDFENGIGGFAGFHARAGNSRYGHNGSKALVAYRRSAENSGVSHSLLGNIDAGSAYSLRADVRIGSNKSLQAQASAYLYVEVEGSQGQYLPIASVTTQGNNWAVLQGNVQIPAGKLTRADLLLVGTQKQHNLLIDNLELRKQ